MFVRCVVMFRTEARLFLIFLLLIFPLETIFFWLIRVDVLYFFSSIKISFPHFSVVGGEREVFKIYERTNVESVAFY